MTSVHSTTLKICMKPYHMPATTLGIRHKVYILKDTGLIVPTEFTLEAKDNR